MPNLWHIRARSAEKVAIDIGGFLISEQSIEKSGEIVCGCRRKLLTYYTLDGAVCGTIAEMRTMNARQGRAPALTSPKKKPSSKKYSDVSLVNEEKKEEERPESAVVVPPRSSLSSRKKKGKGTILEAAFVDPAYAWPPAEGQGKNAIELQATLELLKDQGGEDSDDETNTESHKPKSKRKLLVKLFSCCKSEQDVEEEDMELMREKAARYAAEEKEQKKKLKYNRVPEGILIYRLDTSDNTLTLLSKPHSKTNMSVVLRKMKIVQADAAPDKSRRGMLLTCGVTGRQMMLVACEQRTAIAWFEAISLMLAKKDKGSYFGMSLVSTKKSECLSADLF